MRNERTVIASFEDPYIGTAVLNMSVVDFFLLLTGHGAEPVVYKKAGILGEPQKVRLFTEALLDAGATAVGVCLTSQCKNPGNKTAPHGIAVTWQSAEECLAMLGDTPSYEMFASKDHDVARLNALSEQLEAEGAVVFMIFLLPEGVECKEDIKRFLRKERPVLRVVPTAEA